MWRKERERDEGAKRRGKIVQRGTDNKEREIDAVGEIIFLLSRVFTGTAEQNREDGKRVLLDTCVCACVWPEALLEIAEPSKISLSFVSVEIITHMKLLTSNQHNWGPVPSPKGAQNFISSFANACEISRERGEILSYDDVSIVVSLRSPSSHTSKGTFSVV